MGLIDHPLKGAEKPALLDRKQSLQCELINIANEIPIATLMALFWSMLMGTSNRDNLQERPCSLPPILA